MALLFVYYMTRDYLCHSRGRTEDGNEQSTARHAGESDAENVDMELRRRLK